jgi:hypothetical protein
MRTIGLWSLLLAAACVPRDGAPAARAPRSALVSPQLVEAGDEPALFTSSADDAGRVGFLSSEVAVEIAGPAERGRVPVRIEGPLRARGFVDERALRLRVQRRGRLRGAPVYVGPNDLVQVVGQDGDRHRVRAIPALADGPIDTFEGSYPAAGLAAQRAASDAEAPPSGTRVEFPSGRELVLYEQPGGARAVSVAARPAPYPVEVLNKHGSWSALRIGRGPYVIGWAELGELRELGPDAAGSQSAVSGALPARIASEQGELKRVPAGTKVVFGDQVIAVFKAPGWARVLRVYEQDGFSDVFAAVDDDLTVRGLVLTTALEAAPNTP